MRVHVNYSLMAEDGSVYKTDSMSYWETMPAVRLDVNGEPLPDAPDQYPLPKNVVGALQELFKKIKGDIAEKWDI